MQTVLQLKEELSELTTEAQALVNLRDAGESTQEQDTRCDELLLEETGEIDAKAKQVASGQKYEGEKKRLASLQLAQSTDNPSNPLEGTQWNLQTGKDFQLDTFKLDQLAVQRIPGKFRNRGKLMAFRNDDRGRKEALDCGMWFKAFLRAAAGKPADKAAEKWCEQLGWDVLATATVGDDASGGYNVPSPLDAAFVEYREAVAVVRSLADFRAMSANTLDVNKLRSGPAVTYPGEATAITPSDQVWEQINLAAVKRAVLHYMSTEYQDDAIINTMDQIVSRMAFEFAKQEDNEAINGDGTGTYGGETGLLAALDTLGKHVGPVGGWGTLTLSDFTATMALLPDQHWGQPTWLMSAAFYYGVALDVMAAAGGNTIATLEEGGRAVPMLLGYPVRITGQMPRASAVDLTSALFGTFRDGVLLGDRQGLRLAVSEHVKFNEDVTGVRGTTRYDWNVHEGGSTSIGAYVGLDTAAT